MQIGIAEQTGSVISTPGRSAGPENHPTSSVANEAARLASAAKPSAPICLAYSSVTGAPPTITLTLARSPASSSASITDFIDGIVVVNSADRPIMSGLCSRAALTKESDAMSKGLKRRGFSFVGPTICYAFMQSMGMVNDHTTDCFRYRELRTDGKK